MSGNGALMRGREAASRSRAIASQLFVAEKAVDRHVSVIFSKLGVSSRSAATAYDYQHRLF